MYKPSSAGPKNRILISDLLGLLRVAYLENNSLRQLYVEDSSFPSQVGGLYRARVIKKQPGLDAWFLNLGNNQDAFLHTGDLSDNFSKKRYSPLKKSLLVQVIKDPLKGKGVRVSTHISLAGNFLVYQPESQAHIGVSRRISDENERQKLESLVAQWNLKAGVIVRTNAVGASREQLKQDLNRLIKKWQWIQGRYHSKKTPGLIEPPEPVIFQILKSFLTRDVEAVMVDNFSLHQQITSFVRELWPKWEDRVCFYDQRVPLFDKYDVEEELNRCLKPRVWLPSGGFIVIEETEAAVVVDVNTGRFKGRKNTHDTLLQINQEAAIEICKQLILRNMGGIIVVDFIDMKIPECNEQLMQLLQQELAKDLSPTRLLPLSEFGTVQITRKRTRVPLFHTLYDFCPECAGGGHIKKPLTVAGEILRRWQIQGQKPLKVTCHPRVARFLKPHDRKIHLLPDSSFHIEDFEFH